GFEIFKVNGWDYAALVDTYEKASQIARHEQVPVMIHVVELTQPQGPSTSGSHECYKDENRLAWEAEYDCLAKIRKGMLSNNIATEETLETLEKDIKKQVNEGKRTAWNAFIQPIQQEQQQAIQLLNALANSSDNHAFINKITQELASLKEPIRKDIATTCRKALRYVVSEHSNEKMALQQWLDAYFKTIQPKYSSHLYSESSKAALNIKAIAPTYDSNAEEVDGRVVIRDNFDAIFSKHPEILVFGEDAGTIGDVNQGLEGMQEKYGELRVSDVGIRDATILGQGIGMAMRGLRPIAEIQYLDYILYALQIMSDDLASLQYRTKGRQKSPLIIRTRGHRLEGIWHSGSQM